MDHVSYGIWTMFDYVSYGLYAMDCASYVLWTMLDYFSNGFCAMDYVSYGLWTMLVMDIVPCTMLVLDYGLCWTMFDNIIQVSP